MSALKQSPSMSHIASTWNRLAIPWPSGIEALVTDVRKPLRLSGEKNLDALAVDAGGPPPSAWAANPQQGLHSWLSQPLDAPSHAALEQWTHLLVEAMASFAPPAAGQSVPGRVDSHSLALAIVSPQ